MFRKKRAVSDTVFGYLLAAVFGCVVLYGVLYVAGLVWDWIVSVGWVEKISTWLRDLNTLLIYLFFHCGGGVF